MSNRRFTQFYQTLHKSVVQLDCNFTVAAADSAGLGITGLVGAGIENVFMHTSATPGNGNGSYLNPNPANGIIIVQFEDNYPYLIGAGGKIATALSGSAILVASAGVTNNTTYVITVVGTTTTAGWQHLGLPLGVVPAVGAAFVATATTTSSGTGAVQVQSSTGSGVGHLQIIGNPNKTITSGIGALTGASTGPYLIMGAYSTNTLTAPTDGSLIRLEFTFSNSFIQNQGY